MLATGDAAGAADCPFRRALEANPNDFTSNLQLAVVLKQDQNFDDALPSICAARCKCGQAMRLGVRYQLASN